jgi:hypothetical protein
MTVVYLIQHSDRAIFASLAGALADNDLSLASRSHYVPELERLSESNW